MRASVPCESSNRPGRQQQLPDCLADNNIARKYHTQALHPKTRINACNRPLHKIPTPQSASQNISKIADRFQYPPCSARVSRLTYQIIGVRYPELVKPTAEGWRYGRYVSTEATLQGGFSGMFLKVLCTLSVTLGHQLNGCKQTSWLVMSQPIT